MFAQFWSKIWGKKQVNKTVGLPRHSYWIKYENGPLFYSYFCDQSGNIHEFQWLKSQSGPTILIGMSYRGKTLSKAIVKQLTESQISIFHIGAK